MSNLDEIYQQAPLNTKQHFRLSDQGRLVYPVLSRRAQGVSLGVNLNPDRICNYGCVYCQVDRTEEQHHNEVSVSQVLEELQWFLEKISKNQGQWRGNPVRDIAFSGDGEPTTCKNFPELVTAVIQLIEQSGLPLIPRLITNASRFHIPEVKAAIQQMVAAGGDIWAKLDTGDAESHHALMRTKIPYTRILENLQTIETPLTLQSCFMQVEDQPFATQQLESYVSTVQQLMDADTTIEHIQSYTLARPPAVDTVCAWSAEVMQQIEEYLQQHLDVPITTYC